MTAGDQAVPREGLTPEEWILVLLAGRNRPIRGKLMLMKTMFIAAKEIVPEADKALAFYPKDYGPFSRHVAVGVEHLVRSGFVLARGAGEERETDRTDFSLTPTGKAQASQLFERLPAEVRKRIGELRDGAEEMGYTGIVRYVYAKYPEYISASKIRTVLLGRMLEETHPDEVAEPTPPNASPYFPEAGYDEIVIQKLVVSQRTADYTRCVWMISHGKALLRRIGMGLILSGLFLFPFFALFPNPLYLAILVLLAPPIIGLVSWFLQFNRLVRDIDSMDATAQLGSLEVPWRT